jgi:hypothetical protein
MASNNQPLDETLDARIEAALCELAFDNQIPAQSRVAALRELRQIEAERKDRDRASALTSTTDPGNLKLEDINRELGLD